MGQSLEMIDTHIPDLPTMRRYGSVVLSPTTLALVGLRVGTKLLWSCWGGVTEPHPPLDAYNYFVCIRSRLYLADSTVKEVGSSRNDK